VPSITDPGKYLSAEACGAQPWLDSGKCGPNNPTSTGEPGQCDPLANGNGKGPCCSTLGWCGNSTRHCDCDGCINYDTLQSKLDRYCKSINCHGNFNARFGVSNGGTSKTWRCYKTVKADIFDDSCVSMSGELVKCSAPDPSGGGYCTRDKELKEIIDRNKQVIDA